MTFENNPFVRLSAINALEELKALRPLSVCHSSASQTSTNTAATGSGTPLAIVLPDSPVLDLQDEKSQRKKANLEAIKELKERAIIEQNNAVKFKIRKVLKDQCGIVCKDSDLKELQMIKEQVGNLCTKDKVIELLMAN